MLESTRIVTSHRDTPGARTGGRSCCSGDDPVGATLIADDCGEIAIAELTGPDIGAPDRRALRQRDHRQDEAARTDRGSESAPIVDDDGGGSGLIPVELLPAGDGAGSSLRRLKQDELLLLNDPRSHLDGAPPTW